MDYPSAKKESLEEEVFSYQVTKGGIVFIFWHGKTVTTLKGKHAESFLAKVGNADSEKAQLVMAKVTGNFKRGNERL